MSEVTIPNNAARWWGASRCPFCLEPSPATYPYAQSVLQCGVCRHRFGQALAATPLGAHKPDNALALLHSELDLISDARYVLKKSFKHLCDGQGAEYEAEQERDTALNSAIAHLKQRGDFLVQGGDVFAAALALLPSLGNDGDLSQALESQTSWRQAAYALVAAGVPASKVAEFQVAYVDQLSWGVFGSGNAKHAQLTALAGRLRLA